MKWAVMAFLLAFVSAFAAPAYSASFDCSKSSGKIEKLVCSNGKLSERQLTSYKDGSKAIDVGSVVTIFGDRPN